MKGMLSATCNTSCYYTPALTPAAHPPHAPAVSDADRVALNSMKFASPESAGASSRIAGGVATSSGHTGETTGLSRLGEGHAPPLPPSLCRARTAGDAG